MHVAEGILPLRWACLWFVVAVPFVAWGLHEIRKRSRTLPSYKAMVGITGAAVFVISVLPVPIPVVGSCSHPCGIGLAAILIGPAPAVVTAAIALFLQALFLAHGGLTTLGSNIVSMGIVGAFTGYAAFRMALTLGLPRFPAAFLADLFADWATYAATNSTGRKAVPMLRLYSDIFSSQDNLLTRLDARAKLSVALFVVIAVLLADRIYLPLAVLGICLGASLLIRVRLIVVLMRLLLPLLIVLALFVFKLFMVGDTVLFSVTLAGYQLTGYEEGLYEGSMLGARVLGAVSAMLMLTFVTLSHEIFRALRWFRIPQELVELAMLMYRYVFVFLEQASDVLVAQRTRLGYCGMHRSLSSAGLLAGSMVARSLDQTTRTHEAMTTRCYTGKIPIGPMAKAKPVDIFFILIAVAVVSGLFVCLEGVFP